MNRSQTAPRSALTAVFCLCLAWPLSLEAHHIVSQYGIAPAEPLSRASLQFEIREFQFEGGPSGMAEVAIPRLQYAPVSWLSATAQLPVAGIQYDGAADRFGIGDLAVGAQARLYATEHGGFILSAGLGSEYPTGNVDAGLGAGHFELSPFVVASSSPTDHLVLFGSLTDQFALGGDSGSHDDHAHEHDHSHGGHGHHASAGSAVHGAVIAPHADHELRTRVGAAYVAAPFYVSANNALVYAWSRENPVGPYTVGAEVGWRPIQSGRIALGLNLPVAGPDRFLWTSHLSAAWTF